MYKERSDFLAITWIKDGKYNPDAANEAAEKFLNDFVKHTNEYIENPESHLGKLGWITSIITLYCSIKSFEVADAFFQEIDLPRLAKLYQTETPSFFCNFLRNLPSYFKKINSHSQRTKHIECIFQKIDLTHYASYVNEELQKRLEIFSHKPDIKGDKIACFTRQEYINFLEQFPNTEEALGPIEKYDDENLYVYINIDEISYRQLKILGNAYNKIVKEFVNKTMGSIIQDIVKFSYGLANLVNDIYIQDSIRSKVSNFYSRVNFSLLGKLMEAQKKEISSISQQLGRIKGKQYLIQFLSEINFERLALSYNQNPIGNTCLAKFCTKYLTTKQLLQRWKSFFETLDFSIPFKSARFKKEEYNELIEKFPSAKDILEPLSIIKNNDICINFSKISDAQKKNLGIDVVDEVIKHVGFNYTENTLIFQIMIEIFAQDNATLTTILKHFDFRQIGLKARGKKPQSIRYLLRHLTRTNLNSDRYRDFIEALGFDECKRLLRENSRNLAIILKNKCKYNEKELQNLCM